MLLSALLYEQPLKVILPERSAHSPRAIYISTGEVAADPFARFGYSFYGAPLAWRMNRQQEAFTGHSAGTTRTMRLRRVHGGDAAAQQQQDLKWT